MKSEQRLEIIGLTCRMFAAEGIKTVRMDDIAQRAGVSKRTLYEEFSDKNELTYLAIRHYFDWLDSQNVEIAKKSPNIIISIIDTLHNVTKHSETSWRLLNTLRRFNKDIYDKIFEERSQHQGRFLLALSKGVEQGLLLSDVNMELSARMFEYIAESIVHDDARLVLPAGVSVQSAFMEALINFMRGISTQEGVKIIDDYIKSKRLNKE